MTTGNTPERAAALAQLSERFSTRRCFCGEPACMVLPGNPSVRAEIGILVKRAVPDRNRCLQHGFTARRRATA